MQDEIMNLLKNINKNLEDLKKYYDIETMIPLDTYPYSAKIETIVKLKRK